MILSDTEIINVATKMPRTFIIKIVDYVPTILYNFHPFQSRHNHTIKLFENVYRTVDKSKLPANKTILMYPEDSSTSFSDYWKGDDCKIFTYSYNDTYEKRKDVIAIPDFSVYGWPEARIPDIFTFIEHISPNISNFNNKIEKLFWIGAITHPEREHIINTYKNHSECNITVIQWSHLTTFVTMEEHAQYKYLLDIRGSGWSARLKFLLACGSVVFLVERNDKEYYFDRLVPWFHYVPVSADGSDLIKNLEIIKDDKDLALSIATNAVKLVKEIFTEKEVYEYMAQCINEY